MSNSGLSEFQVSLANKRFPRSDTLAKAADTDPGFDLPVFAQMLRAHRRVDDQAPSPVVTAQSAH